MHWNFAMRVSIWVWFVIGSLNVISKDSGNIEHKTNKKNKQTKGKKKKTSNTDRTKKHRVNTCALEVLTVPITHSQVQ